MAVGWAGQWQARFHAAGADGLRVEAGQQTTHFKLLPGETTRTPRILLVFWKGDGPLRGNNLLRQVVIRHYLPRRDGKLVFPPISACEIKVGEDGTYEQSHLKAMPIFARRGVEAFWGESDPAKHWYVGAFPEGTGNWTVNPVLYPHGLKPVVEAARQAGLKYSQWYEPERAAPGTQLGREHPEWLIRKEHPDKPSFERWMLFRLDLPEARRWLTDLVDRHLTEAGGVGWFRQDFNMGPLVYRNQNDAPDRRGITEAKYIEGLCLLWDELFSRHPGMVIDICASGGRRIDIETSRYGMPLWQSDMPCLMAPNPAGEHSFEPLQDVIKASPVFDVPRLERVKVDGEAGDWGEAGFRADALAGV